MTYLKNKELQELKEHYHKLYLNICWKKYTILAIIAILAQILLILFFEKNCNKFMIIFPLIALTVGMITDHIVSKSSNRIEFVFLFFTVLNGMIITHEGLQYTEYRFHETWLLFYSLYLVISIATCFRWKKMVFVFMVVQTYNIILLHINYTKISTYLYVGYMFATVLIPLICMIVARILLGFISLQHNNQELINTIKRILQVFPEGIIIQSLDENTRKFVVKFANNEALQKILKYEEPLDKPIDNTKLDFKVIESIIVVFKYW